MIHEVRSSNVHRFYLAALHGLQLLDRRSGGGRRFGPEADARWAGFAGHLRVSDRLDMLLRDGAVVLGPAFSAAQVFQLPGLAADEPFGADWPGLTEDTAKALWREVAQQTELEPDRAVDRCAEVLGLDPSLPEPRCEGLAPATRLLVTGGKAIMSSIRAFAHDEALSWNEQVMVVASGPAERQLAGLAAAILGQSGPTRLIAPPDDEQARQSPADLVRKAGLTGVDRVLVSEDADPRCRSFVQAAAA